MLSWEEFSNIIFLCAHKLMCVRALARAHPQVYLSESKLNSLALSFSCFQWQIVLVLGSKSRFTVVENNLAVQALKGPAFRNWKAYGAFSQIVILTGHAMLIISILDHNCNLPHCRVA